MTDMVHAACTGCFELIPITPGQLFSLVLIGAFTVAVFVVAEALLGRYNR